MSDEKKTDSGPLTILRTNREGVIVLAFTGKSIVRDPTKFLLPTMTGALDEAEAAQKKLILDFSNLTYMNSSTFTPLIKVLQRARLGKATVEVIYNKNQHWQQVSFSALAIFRTEDGRVGITAK